MKNVYEKKKIRFSVLDKKFQFIAFILDTSDIKISLFYYKRINYILIELLLLLILNLFLFYYTSEKITINHPNSWSILTLINHIIYKHIINGKRKIFMESTFSGWHCIQIV